MEPGPRSQMLRGKPTIHLINSPTPIHWCVDDELMGGCSLAFFFWLVRGGAATAVLRKQKRRQREKNSPIASFLCCAALNSFILSLFLRCFSLLFHQTPQVSESLIGERR